MPSPGDLKYTKEHEWVRVESDPSASSEQAIGTVGITDYAQDQLGDIVFVDLPAAGADVSHLQKFGEIDKLLSAEEYDDFIAQGAE